MWWIVLSTLFAIIMAVFMIIFRLKQSKKPTNLKKIILPPIFMSSGALMFAFPIFRIPWPQAFESLLLGALFSLLLLKATRFEVKDKCIYIVPTKLFLFIFISLLIIRISLKVVFGSMISLGETAGVFFLLAFGMILNWRVMLLIKYYKTKKSLHI
ncbi:cytochrome c biogenesis protein CcdC [Gracilibacillus sp. YIM 98692]|uniref:CcdC family protein n=1 Tax=Gracilibacillus sp. YIM 98692 TaxID=2663532 RepID=UPI0013D06249|nr:cytochrome c biogenesis protein CcdC [Gracilibacillus sp. YIM 98692]